MYVLLYLTAGYDCSNLILQRQTKKEIFPAGGSRAGKRQSEAEMGQMIFGFFKPLCTGFPGNFVSEMYWQMLLNEAQDCFSHKIFAQYCQGTKCNKESN